MKINKNMIKTPAKIGGALLQGLKGKTPMKLNKKHALIGGAVLGGVALLATATAHTLRKKKDVELSDMDVDDETAEMLMDMVYEVQGLREALMRSYTSGAKLREDHAKMYNAIKDFAGEDAPILKEVGATPENDPYVDAIVANITEQLDIEQNFYGADEE